MWISMHTGYSQNYNFYSLNDLENKFVSAANSINYYFLYNWYTRYKIQDTLFSKSGPLKGMIQPLLISTYTKNKVKYNNDIHVYYTVVIHTAHDCGVNKSFNSSSSVNQGLSRSDTHNPWLNTWWKQQFRFRHNETVLIITYIQSNLYQEVTFGTRK